MAERVFRAVLVSPVVNRDSGDFEVTLVSDLTDDSLQDLTLVMEVKRWDAFDVKYTESVPIG